ncbi:TPA: AAA family ATPase [Aeromonas hydrophila]
MSDRPKGIRTLEDNANKGSLSAIHQLMKNFADGRYVQQNNKQADIYRNQLIKHSENADFYLKRLSIINFKRFEKISIDFNNRNITAFIGDNGSGKSTILEAALKALSWLSRNIVSEKNYNGMLIDENEIKRKNNSLNEIEEEKVGDSIHYNPQVKKDNNIILEGYEYLNSVTPPPPTASIAATVSLNESNDFTLTLNKASRLHSGKVSGEYTEFIELGSIYQSLNTLVPNFNLPLIAYYPVERSIDLSKSDVEKKLSPQNESGAINKVAAYDGALSGRNSFESFVTWFRLCDDIVNEQNVKKSNDELNRLRQALSVTNEAIASIYNESEAIKAPLNDYLKNLEDRIIKLESANRNYDLSAAPYQIRKELEYVKEAIYSFIPEFSNLRIERLPIPDMLVDKDGLTLSVSQLSQGEKSLLALVGDIARRLVMLNPSAKNPLKDGQGIVLIDEIDLHLHPKWQQRVVPKLIETFQRIQFVISTHSPIIASTIHHSGIIRINNGNISPASKGSQGAESSRLLKQLYQVENRDPNSDSAKKLEAYKKYVYDDKWACDDAIKLKNELIDAFGDSEPELAILEEYIDTRTWEIEIEKDN